MNNKRLNIIASLIKENEVIVDVGCDHAYLSKILEKKGIKSIACDIVPSIINDRKKENSKYITYYLSDGLTNIDEELYDYPVLSGMGAYTIIDILKNSSLNFDKVLTCSNNKYDILRSKMSKLGFMIDYEIVVKDMNKFYNIIAFKKGHENLSEKEIYIGKNHKDKKMLNEKNKYLKNKYLKLKDIPENSKIKKELKYL